MNAGAWLMLGGVQEFLFKEIFLQDLLWAARYTVYLTALAMPMAVILGMLLALMRTSRHVWLSWPAGAYIEVVRGTPLLVQLYLVYYSLPRISEALTFDNFWVGVICLAGNYAAYEAEIHRAGLQAVDKGQREAALSLGMSERTVFLRVVMPQAVRIVVPPLINDLIAMLKDSCLVSVIALPELLQVAISIGKSRGTVAQMLVAAAAIYLILSLVCYALGKLVERKLKLTGSPELSVTQPHGH